MTIALSRRWSDRRLGVPFLFFLFVYKHTHTLVACQIVGNKLRRTLSRYWSSRFYSPTCSWKYRLHPFRVKQNDGFSLICCRGTSSSYPPKLLLTLARWANYSRNKVVETFEFFFLLLLLLRRWEITSNAMCRRASSIIESTVITVERGHLNESLPPGMRGIPLR